MKKEESEDLFLCKKSIMVKTEAKLKQGTKRNKDEGHRDKVISPSLKTVIQLFLGCWLSLCNILIWYNKKPLHLLILGKENRTCLREMYISNYIICYVICYSITLLLLTIIEIKMDDSVTVKRGKHLDLKNMSTVNIKPKFDSC